MKKLVIIGAGGNGQEVLWTAERINASEPVWEIIGFLDGNPAIQSLSGYPCLGDIDWFRRQNTDIYCVCSIANPRIRQRIVSEVSSLPHIHWASLVDPAAVLHPSALIGEGSVIFANSVVSTEVLLGPHVLVNMGCTFSHGTQVGAYCSVYGGVHLAGNVRIGSFAEIGMGTKVIQGLTVGENAVLGAGSVVVRDIPAHCTAIGVPARPKG